MNNLDRWLPWAALAAIAFFSLFGLFQAPNIEGGFRLDAPEAALLFAALFVIGVANTVTARFIVLPRARTNPAFRSEYVTFSAYAFGIAPAIYGLILSLFTGRGLLQLPFTALAIVSLMIMWPYLRDRAPST